MSAGCCHYCSVIRGCLSLSPPSSSRPLCISHNCKALHFIISSSLYFRRGPFELNRTGKHLLITSVRRCSSTHPARCDIWCVTRLCGTDDHPLTISISGRDTSNGPNTSGDDHGTGEQFYVPELQFARCMSNRYRNEEFPRCVSCTRRWAGDTCRFQGIRFFMRDAQRNLLAVSFNEHHNASQATSMEYPAKWNRSLEREHITRTKVSITPL